MKIAIIGSGIAGLSTAFYLASDHEITLFEAEGRLGGHTNTVPVVLSGKTHHVDTGFIVHNEKNYPLFRDFLQQLGVETQDADMSFSVSHQQPFLEFSGTGPRGLFAQPKNLVSPTFWKLLVSIARFGRLGRKMLRQPSDGAEDKEETVAEFLNRHSFSTSFKNQYLIPLGSSIWSADPRTFLEFPVRALLYFFNNHGLLTFMNRPKWQTVVGGSSTYIDALLKAIPLDVRLHSKVNAIQRTSEGVAISTSHGVELFDEVICATHSDQALAMLSDPTPEETSVLGAIRFQANQAVLHTDRLMLPALRTAWAAWNYYCPDHDSKKPTLTYWMNRLQRLDASEEICVTLNRSEEINPDSIVGIYDYAHPMYDGNTFAAQRRWDEINGTNSTWFVGAWWGYGFHEDGVRSARRVADAIASVKENAVS